MTGQATSPATTPPSSSAVSPAASSPERRPGASRRRRAPVRHFLVVSHRWVSLVLGVLLVVVTTSGVAVLYQPELHRALNTQAYPATAPAAAADQDVRPADDAPGAPGALGVTDVGLADAAATVRAAHPEAAPAAVYATGDVYTVVDETYTSGWTVDRATGAVLGHVGPDPAWLGFAVNLHECLLSCEGMPGYLPVLAVTIPHTAWLGEEADVTVGGLLLGMAGVLLLFLCASGLWLWFPRPQRFLREVRRGLTIRWDRGRFARDTDLHKVIGVLALAPLTVWGLTGAGYELGAVEQLWYAALPGSEQEGPVPVAPTGTSDTVSSAALPVSGGAAVALALAAHPGTRAAALVLPTAEEPSMTVWLSTPHDPYGRTAYPGDVSVQVDPATAAAATTYGFPEEPVAQTLWQAWNYPVHSGYVVNGWWRLVWAAFGLTPLALAVTGTSTWLVRRATARNRRAAQQARAAS